MIPTTIAVLAVVLAVAGVAWYRLKFMTMMSDQLALCNYLTQIIYDDEERARQKVELFDYVATLPHGNPAALVAASSIRLIKLSKAKFDNNKEAARDMMALLVSMNYAPEKR